MSRHVFQKLWFNKNDVDELFILHVCAVVQGWLWGSKGLEACCKRPGNAGGFVGEFPWTTPKYR